jgi:hypothetical protein
VIPLNAGIMAGLLLSRGAGMRFVVVLLAAGLCCAQAVADEIDLSLNSDALRFIYLYDLRNTKLQLDGGWLYNDDNGNAVHLGLTLPGFASEGANPVRAGLGGRLVYVDGDLSDQSGFGLGLGGFLSYTLAKFNRITLTGAAYFAPDIATISDLEKYQDYTAKAGYQFTREAEIYLGVRYVKGNFDTAPNVLFDNGMHVGFNVKF